MPTYDYRCPNGHDFEHFFRKISEAASELACPVCGATASRRVSGGAGLLFKGSGFYLTDYGKNAHRKGGPDAASRSSSESSAGDGDGAKSDTGSASPPKTDTAASTPKSDSAKSTDSKSSSKAKGTDTK
jgi:putative FmdB family regulatory protein